MAATDDRRPRDAPGSSAPVGDGGVPEAGGVDLQPDVERIHRAILREPRDPVEGHERPPWFFVASIIVALFWGGWYLGRFGGDFGLGTHVAYASRQSGIAGLAADQSATAATDPVAAGQTIYNQNCQSCHQGSGEGVAGAFPPVAGSDWVVGDETTLIRIVLHGMEGPVEVAGATYNGVMPAWQSVLEDEDVAAVATYIRQLGENDAGVVSTEQVSAVRAADEGRTRPWTAAELRAAGPVSAPAPVGDEPAAPDDTTGGAPTPGGGA